MTKRILASLLLAAACALAQPNNIGKVAYIEGKVMILSYGSRTPRPAELGESVFHGDQIKTINGKCQINITAGGILRLSPNTTLAFATKEWENPYDGGVIVRKLGERWVENFRQVVGLDPDEPFRVREFPASDYISPPPPELVAAREREDRERAAARQRNARAAQQPAGGAEDPAVAEYRALLPAVLQAEKKPWHTRFEFIANAAPQNTGFRVAYKTFCLIDAGPDTGKDYTCFEFDSVLDLGAIKTAVTDMKRRLGR